MDSIAEPLAGPSDPVRRAGVTHYKDSPAEQTVPSAVPPIVLQSESFDGDWGPARWSLYTLGRSTSSEYCSSHESLELYGPTILGALDTIDIPKSIECTLNITIGGAKAAVATETLAIDYTGPNSYRNVENIGQDIAQRIAQTQADTASSGTLATRQLNFKYGNCTVIGDNVEKSGLPLTTREDWESVCAILENYWRLEPLRKLHVDIFRDYFSYRDRASSEASFAATKRFEIDSLIRYTSENEPYIPRTALMRFNSLQNIREIIIQDDRLNMGSADKEHFIQTVRSDAPCLLAMCVYAGLKMQCLSVFLRMGFSDAKLPTQSDYCHDRCAPDFRTFLNNRGCFAPARFDNTGEHQDFESHVVIPIHFIPVEKDEDDILRAGRQKELEKPKGGTSRVTDAKQSACCGSGSYSNVYRVRIDPDHHRLQKVSETSSIFPFRAKYDRTKRGILLLRNSKIALIGATLSSNGS